MTDISPTFVDEVPESNRGRAAKYNFTKTYEALLKNGKAAQITQGKHFTCSGASMKQYIYRNAKEHGLKAVIHAEEEENKPVVITFSVEKVTEEDRKKAAERAKKRAETKHRKEQDAAKQDQREPVAA